jgi:magnesium chelatase family protein
VEVPAIGYKDLSDPEIGESSASIRARVNKSRLNQLKRFERVPGMFCNAQMGRQAIGVFCDVSGASKALLCAAMEKLGLSGRAYDKILKIARTIADLDKSEELKEHHIAEAVQYRMLDRSQWP